MGLVSPLANPIGISRQTARANPCTVFWFEVFVCLCIRHTPDGKRFTLPESRSTGLRIPQNTLHVGWKASCPIRRANVGLRMSGYASCTGRKAFCSCLKNMTSSIIRAPPPSGCSRCSCPSCTFCHPTRPTTRPDVENPIGRWDDASVLSSTRH